MIYTIYRTLKIMENLKKGSQNIEMKTIERCLHQVYPSKVKIPKDLRSNGDCFECEYNEENKNCKSYYPIKIKIYDVKKQKI